MLYIIYKLSYLVIQSHKTIYLYLNLVDLGSTIIYVEDELFFSITMTTVLLIKTQLHSFWVGCLANQGNHTNDEATEILVSSICMIRNEMTLKKHSLKRLVTDTRGEVGAITSWM